MAWTTFSNVLPGLQSNLEMVPQFQTANACLCSPPDLESPQTPCYNTTSLNSKVTHFNITQWTNFRDPYCKPLILTILTSSFLCHVYRKGRAGRSLDTCEQSNVHSLLFPPEIKCLVYLPWLSPSSTFLLLIHPSVLSEPPKGSKSHSGLMALMAVLPLWRWRQQVAPKCWYLPNYKVPQPE